MPRRAASPDAPGEPVTIGDTPKPPSHDRGPPPTPSVHEGGSAPNPSVHDGGSAPKPSVHDGGSAPKPPPRGIRMAELSLRSGVPRETIHFYLREGLLQRPVKGGATVAYYG